MAQIKSWTVSDKLWAKVEPLVPVKQRQPGRRYRRKPGAGRKPMAARSIFSAIVYVLRTGCQWKALPKEFGSASAVHKHFQQWQQAGFFVNLWRSGLVEYDGMEGIAWEWQSIDGATGKAPLAIECVGPNPTDRGKNGRKRSLLVDARGVPLSLIASGANVHDVKLLQPPWTEPCWRGLNRTPSDRRTSAPMPDTEGKIPVRCVILSGRWIRAIPNRRRREFRLLRWSGHGCLDC